MEGEEGRGWEMTVEGRAGTQPNSGGRHVLSRPACSLSPPPRLPADEFGTGLRPPRPAATPSFPCSPRVFLLLLLRPHAARRGPSLSDRGYAPVLRTGETNASHRSRTSDKRPSFFTFSPDPARPSALAVFPCSLSSKFRCPVQISKLLLSSAVLLYNTVRYHTHPSFHRRCPLSCRCCLACDDIRAKR